MLVLSERLKERELWPTANYWLSLSPPLPFSGFNFFSSVETRLRNSFVTL
jgi:hypothetical protein